MSPNSSATTDPLKLATERLPGRLSRLLGGFSGKRRPLQHIQAEVTSFCPGACVYCPRGILRESWRCRHMQDETFAALVPLMLLSGRVHLQGWGEPFAHPRLTDYATLARKAGCAVSTTSCGLVMNEALARRVVTCGMDIVAFSLVGTDEQSNAPRRNVPFAGVHKAVATLQKAKKELGSTFPEIHFSYLLLADRLDAVKRLPELMEEWDIPESVVSTLDMPVLPEHWQWAYRPEEVEKIAKAQDVLAEAAERAASMGRSLRFCLPGRIAGNCRENVAHSCYVDADGLLSPCIYLNVPFREELFPERTNLSGTRRVCGNINITDPVSIWNRVDYADFRGDLEHGAAPPSCRSCPKRFERMF